MLIHGLVLFFVIFTVTHQLDELILPTFYWNQTTFRSSQDGSLIFEVRLGDVMDLICPFYDEQQSYMTSELEHYDIYRVSFNEYNLCNIDRVNIDPTTRLVIACNSPYDVMKYTLNIRSYLPIPNGFEFRSNQTYYFLSTSPNHHHQCYKLQIFVHDHNRVVTSPSTVSTIGAQEQKSSLFSHHHRHATSPAVPADKKIDESDLHRPLSHAIKAQRHSDPYAIQWITETSHPLREADDSHRTTTTTMTNSMKTSISSSNILNFAANASSSTAIPWLSIPPWMLLCLLLSLR